MGPTKYLANPETSIPFVLDSTIFKVTKRGTNAPLLVQLGVNIKFSLHPFESIEVL